MTIQATDGTGGQAAAGTSGEAGQTATSQKTGEKTDLATLPADVQTLIRELREEAKGYRLEKESLETKVGELTDEVETAQAASRDLSETAAKAQRAITLRTLRDEYGLDAKAEKFLTAETEEELKEQAEALSAFVIPAKKDADQEKNAGTAGGGLRPTDPAQQGAETVDGDAARAAAFFGG